MKKIIATILTLGALNIAQAQEQTTAPAVNQPAKPANKPTPEQIATRQSMHLQKMLGLSDDQKQKTYQAVLTRASAIQTIRAKYGPEGDKKAMHTEVKPVKEQFVQTMNGILTPEQKIKWEEYRLKMKENRTKNKSVKEGPPAGGNGDPKKLRGDDDGIDD
jgi:hypothetical protein